MRAESNRLKPRRADAGSGTQARFRQRLLQDGLQFRPGTEEPGPVAMAVPVHIAAGQIQILPALQVMLFHGFGRVYAWNGLTQTEVADAFVGLHEVKLKLFTIIKEFFIICILIPISPIPLRRKDRGLRDDGI